MTSWPPCGWKETNLGDIAVSVRNGIFAKRPTDEPIGTKILRISAVRNGVVDQEDIKYVSDLDTDQVGKFSVAAGDILITRYNGSRRLVGIAGLVTSHEGPLVHPDKLIRVVLPRDRVDSKFISYQLSAPFVRSHLEPRIRTTAGQSGISGADVRSIPLVLPGLMEQRRIVEVLEGHLSRLDAATDQVRLSRRPLAVLESQVIRHSLSGGCGPRGTGHLAAAGCDDGLLPGLPAGWLWARLGDVADVVGGVTKDAKKQSDPTLPEWPYLRVANVQRGRLDLSTVSRIRVPRAKAESLILRPGDILLNEGGDRDKLGRGWVWEGQIENCIHQNHVFRARVRDNMIEPHLLSWAANTFGGPWCERNGKQSVNLASISLSRIRLMPIPLPARDVQAALVRHVSSALSSCQRLGQALDAAELRSRALRRAVLHAAFSGRLTGRSTDTEVVEEMAGV